MINFNISDSVRQDMNPAGGSYLFPTTGMLSIQAKQCMVSGPFYRLVHRKIEDNIHALYKDCYYPLEGLFSPDFWAALTHAERHMAWAVVLDLLAREAVTLRLSLHNSYDAPWFSLQ